MEGVIVPANPFSPNLVRLPRFTQRVLVVEDDPSDFQRLTEIIADVVSNLDLVRTTRVSDALARLEDQQFDAILFSLSADPSASIKRLVEQTDAPIIVLTSGANETLGLQALQDGADDYLEKRALNCDNLRHVLQCALARNIWRSRIYALSLIDDLTGLYNRRGFMTLGEQQLKIACRANARVSLAFADLDALKFINDNFGHSEGDRALRTTAMVLKTVFQRESDLIARIGGDEFAVLWVATNPFSIETVHRRFKRTLDFYRSSERLPYRLSMSVGLCQYPDFSNPLAEMLSQGDQRMYEEKRRSKTLLA
jgi:diguanylate cyclase (GGDEF)-like protein